VSARYSLDGQTLFLPPFEPHRIRFTTN